MSSKKVSVDVLVEGGKASGGPPIGPALGPTGVNVFQVVTKINELTKDFAGLKVPVKITVDPATKQFEVEVGTPPTSALILKELGISKGSGEAGSNIVGNITIDQVITIAKAKKNDMTALTLKAAVLTVVGTCRSLGVTVDGMDPKEVTEKIRAGEYDDKLSGEF